ncbi:MAG: hypothetical protein QOC94_3340 [Actinoplanes sp.]|nr:hypothetical protein [Actinoplanes sp.]
MRTVRARLLLTLTLAVPAVMALEYSAYMVPGPWQYWRLCMGAEPLSFGCRQAHRLWPFSDNLAQVLTVITIFALLTPLLAWWILAPIRALTRMVDQVGPQNLGHRIRPRGRRDEAAQLGRAVDAMMDRIAAGYEGQRRFAANASHELRTPLALQRTLIEVGLAEPLNADQTALLAGQLLRTNHRNEKLIEGLLVLSQADQGLASRTPQDLAEIAGDMVALHQRAAAEADIKLISDLAERAVPGDRLLLERLVRNLLHNAIKYNHAGGHVTIEVAGSPALAVTNTGPIVPPDEVQRLFVPFTRLGVDRIDHSGGSGLGLAIARSIVQAHGGTITVEAQPVGGLRVSVNLPAS